jgi:hypothetical protein
MSETINNWQTDSDCVSTRYHAQSWLGVGFYVKIGMYGEYNICSKAPEKPRNRLSVTYFSHKHLKLTSMNTTNITWAAY